MHSPPKSLGRTASRQDGEGTSSATAAADADDIKARIERISAQLNQSTVSTTSPLSFRNRSSSRQPSPPPALRPPSTLQRQPSNAAVVEAKKPVKTKSPPRVQYSSAEAGGLLDFFANATIEQIFARYGQLSRAATPEAGFVQQRVELSAGDRLAAVAVAAEHREAAEQRKAAEAGAQAAAVNALTAQNAARQMAEEAATMEYEAAAQAVAQGVAVRTASLQQMRDAAERTAAAEAEQAAAALRSLPPTAAGTVMREFQMAVDAAISGVPSRRTGSSSSSSSIGGRQCVDSSSGVQLSQTLSQIEFDTAVADKTSSVDALRNSEAALQNMVAFNDQLAAQVVRGGGGGGRSGGGTSDGQSELSCSLSKIEFDHALQPQTAAVTTSGSSVVMLNSEVALQNMTEFNNQLAAQVAAMQGVQGAGATVPVTATAAAAVSTAASRSSSSSSSSSSSRWSSSAGGAAHGRRRSPNRSQSGGGSSAPPRQVSWAADTSRQPQEAASASHSPAVSWADTSRRPQEAASASHSPARSHGGVLAPPRSPSPQHAAADGGGRPLSPLPASVWTFYPDTDSQHSSGGGGRRRHEEEGAGRGCSSVDLDLDLSAVANAASTPKEFVLAKARVYIAKLLELPRPRHQDVDDGQVRRRRRRRRRRWQGGGTHPSMLAANQ